MYSTWHLCHKRGKLVSRCLRNHIDNISRHSRFWNLRFTALTRTVQIDRFAADDVMVMVGVLRITFRLRIVSGKTFLPSGWNFSLFMSSGQLVPTSGCFDRFRGLPFPFPVLFRFRFVAISARNDFGDEIEKIFQTQVVETANVWKKS